MQQFYLNLKRWVVLLLPLLISANVFAQTNVTGVVRDETGPLPGVSVVVKGTTRGTQTNSTGEYSIKVAKGDVLKFSSIGYAPKEVTVGSASTINVTLAAGSGELNEVVVTSFGIKRQEKSLGYATTTVTAKQLTEAGNTNFASALYGKAPGVKITTAPGGSSSAVNVQIRGINSLNYNTQPLYVVDGVIIRNNSDAGAGGSNNDGYWSDQRIRGNGILDINPQDIESLTVLKGASATALYGSDAMSGAIVITTKKGSKSRGLGVDFNYVGTAEQVAFTPNFQNVYGPGYDRATNLAGGFTEDGWLADPNSPSGFRPRFSSYAQFGPKMEGQKIMWWDGQIRDYTPQPNNYKDLFQAGYSSNANIAISNQTDKVNYRLSATRLDYTGIQRGQKQQKNSFNLNTTLKLSDKISTDIVASYVNTLTHNRPYQLNRVLANFGGFLNRSEKADVLLDNYQTSAGYKYVTLANAARNPAEAFKYNMSGADIMDFFWTQLKNSEDETENRLITSATLNWDVLKNVKFRGRIGSDYTGRNTESQQYNEYPIAFNAPSSTGYYGVTKGQYSVTYGDLLLTYSPKLTKDLSMSVSGGYTSRSETYRDQSSGTNGGLVTENFFSLTNSYGVQTTSATRGFLKSQAIFGILNFNYKNYLFVEGTARNESASTLPTQNNTYFYPSVNAGFVFTDAFKLPEFISYGKLRASYGVVGNKAPRYVPNVLYNQSPLSTSTPTGTVPVTQLTFDAAYGNLQLKPEMKYEQEYGLEARFLKDRLGLDFTYYTNQVKNVIMGLNIAPSVGAGNLIANAATLHSDGLEVGFNGKPIIGKFSWDVRLNFAVNHSKVNNLAPGFDRLTFYTGDQSALLVVAQPNQPIGNILVYPIAKDANGNKIVNSDGLYTIDKSRYVNAGNIQPKIVGGIANTFNYKGFSLDVLVDYRFGGKMVSNPLKYGTAAGMYESTLQYRDAAHGGLAYYIDGSGAKHLGNAPGGGKTYNDGVILEGVNESGQKNSTIVDAATYYLNTYDWGENSVNENAVFKNNYVKLREVVLGYKLPASVNKALHLNNLRFSLVGRNLLYIYRTLKNLDPEAPIGDKWYRQGVDEGSSPATRSFGFSLNANF